MPSPQHDAIVQLLQSEARPETPPSIEEQRQSFEAMTLLFPVPDDVTAESVDAGGVSAEWVRASLVPRTVSRYSRREYGYGWWLRTLGGHRAYYAWGYGGQFIFVIPELDSVIVATSSPNPGAGRRRHRRQLDELIECWIVPAIRQAVRPADQESAP